MRVLLTEVGNASPGDEAITIAAGKRLLGFGCELIVAYRVSIVESFARAGLHAQHVPMPIKRIGPYYSTAEALLVAVRQTQPDLYQRLVEVVASSQVVCVAPGGKYLDGFDNTLKFLTIAVARTLGIPYIILHQSVGPLSDENELALAREIFGDAALLVARDEKTYEFLADLIPFNRQIVYGGDAAIAESYPESIDKPYNLGINLRWSAIGHSTEEALYVLLRRYRERVPGGKILLYSTTTSLPSGILTKAQEFGCDFKEAWCRYPHYLELVGQCSLNISDSFHGVIFSIKARVPTVCLQPDMQSWKLDGLRGDDGESLKVFEGMDSFSKVNSVIEEITRIVSFPEYKRQLIGIQTKILEKFCQQAECAWQAVENKISNISNRGC